MKHWLLRGGALFVAAAASITAGCGSPTSTAPAAVDPPTVQLVQPQQAQWPTLVRANGAVAAWQEAVIGAETGSLQVVEVLADVGDRVKRGQLLARLADDTVKADVKKQDAALAQAGADRDQAQANLRRVNVVGDTGSLSSQQIDEYRAAAASADAAYASAKAALDSERIRLRQTRILAVDDGVISSRSALLGQVVAAGTELFRLVRQDRIEWQAEVDARQLAQVSVGQVARLTLPDGSAVEGRVRMAAPTLSTDTGRAQVYVSLPGGSGAHPGMYASGSIELPATAALTLPESALVLRDGRSDVYALAADGAKVARHTVETGRRREGRVEILSGLDAAARVVASGGAFLSDGAAVRIAGSDKTTTDKAAP